MPLSFQTFNVTSRDIGILIASTQGMAAAVVVTIVQSTPAPPAQLLRLGYDDTEVNSDTGDVFLLAGTPGGSNTPGRSATFVMQRGQRLYANAPAGAQFLVSVHTFQLSEPEGRKLYLI